MSEFSYLGTEQGVDIIAERLYKVLSEFLSPGESPQEIKKEPPLSLPPLFEFPPLSSDEQKILPLEPKKEDKIPEQVRALWPP